MSDVSFSRPGHTWGGKATETLKTSVTPELRDDFERWSRERGYPTSAECLRELIAVAVHGVAHITESHRKRIESLAGSWTGIGRE